MSSGKRMTRKNEKEKPQTFSLSKNRGVSLPQLDLTRALKQTDMEAMLHWITAKMRMEELRRSGGKVVG